MDNTPILQALETLNTYEGEHMPNDISRFREGKDQKSDQLQTNRRSFSPIRQEATLQHMYEQERAYEQERIRKGKMPALTDRKDEEPTGRNNHLTEKIILSSKPTRDKPSLLGGGDALNIGSSLYGRIGSSMASDLQSNVRLAMLAHQKAKIREATRKAEKYRQEWHRDDLDINEKSRQLEKLTFEDFKREYPDKLFDQEEKHLFDQEKKLLIEDYKCKEDIMQRLGPQGWHYMKKYDKSREKKFSDLSSGGKMVYAAKWLADGQKGRSDKQRQKEFYQALDELDQKYRKLNRLTFEDFKREYPEYADNKLFDQQKKSLMNDCDRKFDIIRQLGPEGFYRMKKEEKRRARRSDREASTSGG